MRLRGNFNEKNELHQNLEKFITSHHLHLNRDVNIKSAGDNIILQKEHAYYPTEELEITSGEVQQAFDILKESSMLSVYDKEQQKSLIEKVTSKAWTGGLEINQEVLGMTESIDGGITISLVDFSYGHNSTYEVEYDKDTHIWSVDNGKDFYMHTPTMDKVLEKIEAGVDVENIVVPSVENLVVFDVVAKEENEIKVSFLGELISLDEFNKGSSDIVREIPILSEEDREKIPQEVRDELDSEYIKFVQEHYDGEETDLSTKWEQFAQAYGEEESLILRKEILNSFIEHPDTDFSMEMFAIGIRTEIEDSLQQGEEAIKDFIKNEENLTNEVKTIELEKSH